jgi:hypothetical protein
MQAVLNAVDVNSRIGTESFIIYDESSSPSTDDYIIDADRTTLSFDSEALEGRLSTGYPMKPTFKKIQPRAKR